MNEAVVIRRRNGYITLKNMNNFMSQSVCGVSVDLTLNKEQNIIIITTMYKTHFDACNQRRRNLF